MSRIATIVNHQRAIPVNLPLVRALLNSYLEQLWPDADVNLTIYLVTQPEITRLNETFLQHRGATDVITFDYSDPGSGRAMLFGEIFICVDEALAQARRFRTNWQSELVRYIVHGVLHLSGYDDQQPYARRRMKRAENQWLRRLANTFDLAQIGPPVRKRPSSKH